MSPKDSSPEKYLFEVTERSLAMHYAVAPSPTVRQLEEHIKDLHLPRPFPSSS